MSKTHVIGAGLAGLATAVSLVQTGRAVVLYEASGQAGGRCRSFFDAKLDRTIDNGNHLLLSGNRAAMDYLASIKANDRLIGPNLAQFPFLDVRTGQRWRLQLNRGKLPWWIFQADRRVPDTKLANYFSVLKLAVAGTDRTVTDCVGNQGIMFERLWEPLAVAVLNTPAQTGAACLFWSVLRETFVRGEAECRPRIAKTGLSDAFVDPALELFRRQGTTVRFGFRLRKIACTNSYASHLDFGTETVALNADDSVVLALPPSATADLLPELTVPEESHSIVNVHFRLSEPDISMTDVPFLGLIGGTAQWLFVRHDIASITISAADTLANEAADVVARRTWSDVAVALNRSPRPIPPYRVVKERRATFAQTPRAVQIRPDTRFPKSNIYLAGDWIDTGLPATIEGAIRSGNMAARAIVKDLPSPKS